MNTIQFNYSAPQLPEHVQTASFSFYAKDNNIEGFLCITPGLQGDGRGAVNAPQWLALAEELNYGIIGCYFADIDPSQCNYCRAARGTGQILLDAIAAFNEHASLNLSPKLLLYGHSAGGQFNYNMACFKPGLIKGFIVNKGCCYYSKKSNRLARLVPGLFIIGDQDEDKRKNNIRALFQKGKDLGAKWELVVEPGIAHDVGNSENLSIEFFRKVSKS